MSGDGFIFDPSTLLVYLGDLDSSFLIGAEKEL
jgi:hypothetical protein